MFIFVVVVVFEFLMYSWYQFSIRCITWKYFLIFCELSLHRFMVLFAAQKCLGFLRPHLLALFTVESYSKTSLSIPQCWNAVPSLSSSSFRISGLILVLVDGDYTYLGVIVQYRYAKCNDEFRIIATCITSDICNVFAWGVLELLSISYFEMPH